MICKPLNYRLYSRILILNYRQRSKMNSFSSNKKIFEIDNSYDPFIPKIRYKPNALVPLPEIFKNLDRPDLVKDENFFKNNPEIFKNPYSYEISKMKPNRIEFDQKKPVEKAKSLDETPFKYIDKIEDLMWLKSYIGIGNRSRIKEIGVDLEHHDLRSFHGFTCIIQISTRDHDFIIDTIKLRSEMHILNEIFTDPSLVKVFHGADSDIFWLQKDFGIYVVNMFDTCRASILLHYSKFSLSYLLDKFCQVKTSKKYQMADWRIRPLSQNMLDYARKDTHFLLNIYDNICAELNFGQLNTLYLKCNLMCTKTYQKPGLIKKNLIKLCSKNSHLNSNQLKCIYDLYLWRDKLARTIDESTTYVLNQDQIAKLAEQMPTEKQDIKLKLSYPVKRNINQLLKIIKDAKKFEGKFKLKYDI